MHNTAKATNIVYELIRFCTTVQDALSSSRAMKCLFFNNTHGLIGGYTFTGKSCELLERLALASNVRLSAAHTLLQFNKCTHDPHCSHATVAKSNLYPEIMINAVCCLPTILKQKRLHKQQ